MKYKPGQKVRINKNYSQAGSVREALEELNPPYTATINYISIDPLAGQSTYVLKEILWGWHEEEIEGLYIEPDELIDSRFEILDL